MNNNWPETLRLLGHQPILWAILGIANLPTDWWFSKWFFDDWEDFKEALRFWFQPQWLSLIRGEGWDDTWAEIKLFFWLILCAGAVATEKLAISFAIEKFF